MSHRLFLPGHWSMHSKQSLCFPNTEVSHGQTNPCSWGRGQAGAVHSLPVRVTAVLQNGRARGVRGCVSGVDAGGSPSSSSSCSLSVLTSLGAALLPPPRWLQGRAARPPRVPGPVPAAAPKAGGVLGAWLEETSSDNRPVTWG